MAILIINSISHKIPDGESISELCEQTGIPFNCNSGVCGSCQVKIVEGSENLSELNDEEKDLGLDENNRLACMCKIKSGTVKLTYG